MRLLPVGKGRVQIISGAQHSGRGAEAARAQLAQLQPDRILLDRSLHEHAGEDPIGDLLFDLAGGQRDALWKSWNGPVALLHGDDEPPKKGLKQLGKLLKKQGFHADAEHAADQLEAHFVPQIELLRQWRETRRDRAAKRLIANFRDGGKGVLLTTDAEAELLCERVSQLLKLS